MPTSSRILTVLVLALVASGLAVLPAGAAEDDLVVEGWSGSAGWVESVTAADLVGGFPAITAAGALSGVDVGACSNSGFVSEFVFRGDRGDVVVSTAALQTAFGWSSANVVTVGLGEAGATPGCWSDKAAVTETRRLRVSEITIDDAAGGDGDGFAECAETVVLGVTISSVSETIVAGQVVVDVLGTEADLVGLSWLPLPNLLPGRETVASGGFTAVIDGTVSGSDWITLEVTVGSSDGRYTTHRHIPIGCGLSGSTGVSPRLVFPIAGATHYAREWLTTHNPAIHEGVDLFASRMVPVLAMADGVVSDVNWEHDPHRTEPSSCCAIALRHDSGWESWYLHLNNDTPGTDDGAGWGVMPGLVRGTRVKAGDIIGFAGDSSNAEATAPHLHLELHDPAGNPVDPYDYLEAASRVEPNCTGSQGDCFPFVIMSWNSRDQEVRTVQTLLTRVGFPVGTIDGLFGTRTVFAVRDFQRAAGLGVDGFVDRETWDELHRVVDEGIDLSSAVVARSGDRGPTVVEVQSLLTAAGFAPGPADGIFGSRTESAVRSFQSARGLGVDGVVDDATFAALGVPSTPAAPSTPTGGSRRGDRGAAVVEVQSLLTAAGFAPGPADGIFGSRTESAVRSFQSARGLGVDGVVGPTVLATLRGDTGRTVVARMGDRGPAVSRVQTLLRSAGFAPGPIDGIYGSLTQSAVRAFQTARGLPVDGVVDQATSNALS